MGVYILQINKFSDIVGNSSTISLIKKGLEKKTLPHFILLEGLYGTGKSSVAELIAMSLTCQNSVSGEACGCCDICLSNKKALGRNGLGVSSYIEKVNMAVVAKERNMIEQVRSTFYILHSDEVYIKIFEEFHALSEADQQLILEETARIPENVYIILTTTNLLKIIKEIRSRCLAFNFNRLTPGESAILIDRVNKKLDLKKSDYESIYRKTSGIPRNIIILVEFLSKVEASQKEMNDLLGIIDKSVFLELFSDINHFSLYMEDVAQIESSYSEDIILNQLKEFLVQVAFAIEGDIYTFLSKKEVSNLNDINIKKLYDAIKLIERLKDTEKVDLDILFLKLRRLFCNPMTVQEQKTSANLARGMKSHMIIEKQEPLKLKRFGGDDIDESSNG
jgi:DNA polymerase-3 subunit gamma/tau